MLRPRAAERAAVALLRLLLLLLLSPELRDPGLGVVGAAGAGLPESVIWAVNAGGEAHVDVHGIHFRKDPLEGRVGRGESPSAEPWDPRPVSRAQLRTSSPFLSTGRPHPWNEVSLCRTPRDLARARGLALAGSYREPSRHRVGEKLYLGLFSSCVFSAPHPTQAGNAKTRVALCLAPGGLAGCRSSTPLLCSAFPSRCLPTHKSPAFCALSREWGLILSQNSRESSKGIVWESLTVAPSTTFLCSFYA